MRVAERYSDDQELIRTTQHAHQARLWTSLPAIVVSYNPAAMTISAQPAIGGRQRTQEGSTVDVSMPVCVDVPVCFPKGGGFSMTFPIAAGDECLLVFSSRCIDGWWSQGKPTPPMDARMHDLSDALAIMGPWSQPRAAHLSGGASGSAVQLRSDDGATSISMVGGTITLNATNVVINGTSLTHNGLNVGSTHEHGGIVRGGALTNPPQ